MGGVSDGKSLVPCYSKYILEPALSQQDHLEASWKIRISRPTLTELQSAF